MSQKPHPHTARSDHANRTAPLLRIRLTNAALARLWASGRAQIPELDPDAILIKAGGRPGSDEWQCDWRARLRLLCEALQANADLSPLGRTLAHGQLVSAAKSMRNMRRLWAEQPEIDAQQIARPIIVVGQMRSGTTRVQRLLACDERFRFTRFFESWSPLPVLRRGLLDDRRWRGGTTLAIAQFLNPEFRRLHPTGASQPDEEIGLFNLLMMSAAYEVQWRVPSFVTHCEAMDCERIYDDFKRMLKTLAWLRGGRDERPWILKVPQFSQDLEPLLKAFPDARVVHTLRAADQVIRSSTALVSNQMSLQSASIDPAWVEREWRRKVALREGRTANALAKRCVPVTRLEYRHVSCNWESAMADVYAMLELPLTPSVRRAMENYMARTGGSERGEHAPQNLRRASTTGPLAAVPAASRWLA